MSGKIILVGQDLKSYTITAFGMEENHIYCTVDKDYEKKYTIGTYDTIERTEQVFNSILSSMDDVIVLPDK